MSDRDLELMTDWLADYAMEGFEEALDDALAEQAADDEARAEDYR